MGTRRWAVAGAIALTAVSLNLSGCRFGGEGDGPEEAATTTPVDPKQALIDSTKEIDKGHYRFTFKGWEDTGEGVVHVPSNSASLLLDFKSENASFGFDFLFVDPDVWVKVDLGTLAELAGMEELKASKWLHLERSKLKGTSNDLDLDDPDLAGAKQILSATKDVKQSAPGTYTGTVDLTLASDAGPVDDDVLEELAGKATTLPLEAKVDDQGRLTSIVVDVPAAGDIDAHKLEIHYSEYGSVAAPQKPSASEQAKAPDKVYEIINS